LRRLYVGAGLRDGFLAGAFFTAGFFAVLMMLLRRWLVDLS
jgi:hypothetical protein